jgi:hypothetical protein
MPPIPENLIVPKPAAAATGPARNDQDAEHKDGDNEPEVPDFDDLVPEDGEEDLGPDSDDVDYEGEDPGPEPDSDVDYEDEEPDVAATRTVGPGSSTGRALARPVKDLRQALREARRQAVRDVLVTQPDVPLTPAEQEAALRDLLALMLALMGAKDEDIDRMYAVEPDGSRVAAIERLIYRCLGGD